MSVSRMTTLFTLCAVILLRATAVQAGIIEDFRFEDANGTLLGAAVNTANLGNNWVLAGQPWDPSSVVDGSFRITKSAANQATAHIDIANITTGKAWLVAELAGWNYTSTASTPSEEVRFAFLDNDATSGSTITAQVNIVRSGSGLALTGASSSGGGTGFTNIDGSYALPLEQSTPLTIVLELDKDLNQYSVYHKDGSAPFTSIGSPGSLGERSAGVIREGRSIRFSSTGQFNDTGEYVDISRIYLTDVNPIPEPASITLFVLTAAVVFVSERRRRN